MKQSLSFLFLVLAFAPIQTKSCVKTKKTLPVKKSKTKHPLKKTPVQKDIKKVERVAKEIEKDVKSLITIIDANTFEKHVLKAKHPIILDVYADWCGPCIRMTPTFEKVAQKFKGKKVTFAKIKMDSFEESDKHIKLLKDKLKASINMIPTFLHIEKGKLVKTIVGSQSEDKLTKMVNDLLKK